MKITIALPYTNVNTSNIIILLVYTKKIKVLVTKQRKIIDSSLSVNKLSVQLQAKDLTNDSRLREIKKSAGTWKKDQNRNTKITGLDEILSAIKQNKITLLNYF